MQAVMESRYSIAIADATLFNYPLIFVNPPFEKLTGYSKDEILSKIADIYRVKTDNKGNYKS